MELTRLRAESMPDPALTGRWIAKLPDPSGNVDKDMFVEAISPTFPKVAARPRLGGGRQHYYPEFRDLDGLAIVFYENEEHTIGKWLLEWKTKVYDPKTEFYGLPKGPNGYKRDIIVEFFPNASDYPIMTATYLGCWPTDRQALELAYDQIEGRLVVSAQFAVDNVEFT